MTTQIPFTFNIPSVSELTENIKSVLESHFRDILVEGEISNVKQSRNGHVYFTVKDRNAQLPCVIWRSTAARLNIDLQDGQQVILGGDLQVYPPHGRYQMIVSLVQQAGLGKLQKKFEELKQKLEKEGLFDESHKKPLPPFPFRIGVITSSTGAAFQDIRSTFEQRWPAATLFLYHSSVQGTRAAGELVRGISFFSSQQHPVDLLIIGRGGGSLEDLWPFNEEAVARAIFNCPVPVVSAVGHETDFSISDFVADARAATPTQAAVISTPDINELRYQIEDYTFALENSIRQKIEFYKEYVYRLAHSHALLVVRDKLKFYKSRAATLTEKMETAMHRIFFQKQTRYSSVMNGIKSNHPASLLKEYENRLETATERFTNRYERIISEKTSLLQRRISALEKKNPRAPLEQGFSRVFQEGKWIRKKAGYSEKQSVEIEWIDGRIQLPGAQTSEE